MLHTLPGGVAVCRYKEWIRPLASELQSSRDSKRMAWRVG